MLVVVLALSRAGLGQVVLDLSPRDVKRVVVSVGGAVSGEVEADWPRMLLRTRGVLGVYEGREVARSLGIVAKGAAYVGRAEGSTLIAVFHVERADGERRIGVFEDSEGVLIAEDLDAAAGERPARAEVTRARFLALSSDWVEFAGDLEKPDPRLPEGEVVEAPRPYVPSRLVMDRETLGDRFLAGGSTGIDAADRVLTDETLFLRVPRGYSPRAPVGLVVWVHAMSEGRTPEVFVPALDGLGLACVSAANSGNDRHVANRYQLALDGVRMASRLIHIDPERVYVTGISGGGKVSSMLQACFPDVFRGAVPIVGMSCYEPIPTGTGQFWPAGYRRPGSKVFGVLRTRRIAAITGDHDGNQAPIQGAARIMSGDGLSVRVFDYPDMGHTMPTPDRFLDAMRWVDEVWQADKARRVAEAREALDRVRSGLGENGKLTAAQRRLLAVMCDEVPWTAEAWEGCGLLTGTSR